MRLVSLTLLPSIGGAIGSPGIESLFFTRFGVDFLPPMYMALGVVTFVASVAITASLGRLSKKRLYLSLPLTLSGALVIARVLVGLDLAWFYPVLWLGMYLLWSLQGTLSWGVAAAIFDTRQAKRLFPLFSAGGILGVALGGLITGPLVQLLGTENLLLVWAATLLMVFGVVKALAGELHEPFIPPWRAPPRLTEGLQRGLQFVRRSTLMKWISVAAMFFSVLYFSLAFPFSKAAAGRFPDENTLAGFLGTFQGVTTMAAFLTSLLVANRLYARFGFVGTIVALPLIYLVGFGVQAVSLAFVPLLAFRFLQVVWIEGVASTAYQAVFNIVPTERREQTRAFVEGVPTQIGAILVGALLMLGDRSLQPLQLYILGVGAAAVTTFIAWRAYWAYRGALVEALRAGQSHVFFSEEEPFGGFRRDAPAVAAACSGLSDPDPAVRRVAAEILGNLAAPEMVAELVGILDDEDPEVRAAALRGLAKADAAPAILEVADRLEDPDPEVRLQAVNAIRELAGFPRGLLARIRPLLDDDHPAVRARAAGVILGIGPDPGAEAELVAMVRGQEVEARLLALDTLSGVGFSGAFDLAAEALKDPRPSIRHAAARAIRRADPHRCLGPLIQALGDEDRYVREGVAEGIGRIGAPALDPTLNALSDPTLEDGALLALEHLPVSQAAEPIRAYTRSRVRAALRYDRLWRGIGRDGVESSGNDRQDLLRDSLRDKALTLGNRALRAIGLLGDRAAVALALDSLISEDPNQRANALETLDSSPGRELIRPLLQLWEPRETAVQGTDGWLLDLLDDPDPWLRACAVLVAADESDPEIRERLDDLSGHDPDPFVRSTIRELTPRSDLPSSHGGRKMDTLPTMSMMDRILCLRRVPLFSGLSPSDLKQVAAITGEHYFVDGEVICRQGDPGDEMYIIVSGEVQVVSETEAGRVELARRTSGEYVGEMAILSQEPRMASLIARGDVRLLCIEQRPFESILRERPETSLAVMRVLIARLKETQGTT